MLFTAKLASVLLAVAASAQASVVARSPLADSELSVIFFDNTEFRGTSFLPNPIHPAACINLPDDWLDIAESVIISEGYNCLFFVDGRCEGTGTLLQGSVPSLPDPPLYDNIESFLCFKDSE